VTPPRRDSLEAARRAAAGRALESGRRDALFRDPFALRLAGPGGTSGLRTASGGVASPRALAVRTAVFDELVGRCVTAAGADAVITLAGGFDTRPYRLRLPAELSWTEVEEAAVLEEKGRELSAEKPSCRLARCARDLADAAGRAEFLSSLVSDRRSALAVTEDVGRTWGPDEIASLARDLRRANGFRWWLLDTGPARGVPPAGFTPRNPGEFFRSLGWRLLEVRPLREELHRWRRERFGERIASFLRNLAPAEGGGGPRGRGAVILLERDGGQ
jgi:hypothetical protein